MIRKVFRPPRIGTRTVIDREAVDEVIYTTGNRRDRLLLELMARGGMRIREVLRLKPEDLDGVKDTLWHPKSGSDRETVFIPKRVAERLRACVTEQNLRAGDRIFSLTYNGARLAVRRAGKSLGIALRPHELRRYAATLRASSINKIKTHLTSRTPCENAKFGQNAGVQVAWRQNGVAG
jgi:integrase